MAKNLRLVKNVYFDTSILVRLPLTAPSPDFLNLKDSCDVFKTKLLMPELVLKEYINYNQREVLAGFTKIGDSLKIINDRTSSQILFPFPKQAPLFKETEELMKQKIKNLGIEVFKKDISSDKLEELALKEISFKERTKKKCLRDSLILLSIIEHAKDFPTYLNIFIADDNFFQIEEAKLVIESYKANIKIVKSLPEAGKIVDEILISFGKAMNEARQARLKSFLESQNNKIVEFVRKDRFNSFALALGEPGESPLGGTIEKINAIDYESIHSVRPPDKYAKGDARKEKISFMVRVKFTVLVRFYSFPSGDKLKLEQPGEEAVDILDQYLLTGTSDATYLDYPNLVSAGPGDILGRLGKNKKEETISRNISVEASVLLKLNDNSEEEYSDLQLERIIT